MSSGKDHDQATVVTAIALLPLTQLIPLAPYLPLHLPESFSLSLGVLSGLWFSPDLDIYSRPYRRWGTLRVIWFPYKKLVKHRSPISHTPIFSQLFQLLYFLFALQAFLFIVQSFVHLLVQSSPVLSQFLQRILLLFPELSWYAPATWLYQLWTSHPTWVILYVLGVVIAGTEHILMDIWSHDT